MKEFEFLIYDMITSDGEQLSFNPEKCWGAKYKIDEYLGRLKPLSLTDYSTELQLARPVRDRGKISSKSERFRNVRNYTQVFLDEEGLVIVFETGLKDFGELSYPIPLSMKIYSFNNQRGGEEIRRDLENIVGKI